MIESDPLFLFVLLSFCMTVAALENGVSEEGFWPRWEQRTVDCLAGPRASDCVLNAPGAKKPRDPKNYKCREEPMPREEWNHLARNTTTRIACPIGCEPDSDLSVLQKVPYYNPLCQKYYTYGKYRKDGEWYLWLSSPCRAAITTHCRFKDIPQHGGGQQESQESTTPSPALRGSVRRLF